MVNLIEEHHLMPKTFGGKATEPIHKICHRKIHATFTERELKNEYHTWPKIRSHEEIAKFVKWVSKKHPDFYDSSVETNSRYGKRRR